MVLSLRQPCHSNWSLFVSVSPSSSNVSFYTSESVHTNTARCILFAVRHVMIKHYNMRFEGANTLKQYKGDSRE